jgi:hypothetical protein
LSSIKQLFLGGSSGGYQIERSLRFNSADSAYLNRTFGTPTDNKKWTFSAWIKVSNISSGINRTIFSGDANDGGTNFCFIRYNSLNQIDFRNMVSGVDKCFVNTTAVFRDPSAYFHLQFVFDSNNATQANRQILYINGISVGLTGTLSTSSDACSLNVNGRGHRIGELQFSTSPFDGYMTEVNFIDGQALTPSDFGETDSATGVWKPKKFSGTYGTNGFYLNFSDNSNTTSTTLGKDSSGNGNNWTPIGFSVASGVGNDSLVDTPTSYGTDTGVGGEVRGNYATLNPLINPSADTFSNGNLQVVTSSSNYGTSVSTMATPTTGKWYAECTIVSTAGWPAVGICSTSSLFTATSWIGSFTGVTYYGNSGQKFVNASGSAYGATYGANDVIGVAYDADNLQITFYKNGTTQGTITGVTSGAYYFGSSEWDTASGTQVWNFGQRPFQKWNGSAYVANTAPSGFKALCTQNLPPVTIGATSTTQARNYFDVLLETGTGSARSVTGLNFQPDFLWAKGKNESTSHLLYDAVRGVDKSLNTNNILAEDTTAGQLTSFNSNGYSLPNDTAGYLNKNGRSYVFWNWNAGGSNQTISVGQYATSPANVPSIASTVRANTTAGFSVLTYNPGNTSGTIGHGLNVAPQFIIVRSRTNSGGDPWGVYHVSLGNTKYLRLNTTDAEATLSTVWNNTSPTSTVVSIGTSDIVSSADTSFIMYCFAPVAGYSAFGSYTGNGSTDGPFIYTGFRPRWIMIRRTDSTGNWQIQDTARTPYNWTCAALFADSSAAEVTTEVESTYGRDYLSNGFKIRASHTSHNASGGTYIYAAFAESPFKYSLAR